MLKAGTPAVENDIRDARELARPDLGNRSCGDENSIRNVSDLILLLKSDAHNFWLHFFICGCKEGKPDLVSDDVSHAV